VKVSARNIENIEEEDTATKMGSHICTRHELIRKRNGVGGGGGKGLVICLGRGGFCALRRKTI